MAITDLPAETLAADVATLTAMKTSMTAYDALVTNPSDEHTWLLAIIAALTTAIDKATRLTAKVQRAALVVESDTVTAAIAAKDAIISAP